MNNTILLLAFTFCFSAQGQMVYDWVNTQYDPSEAAEDSFVDLLVLNGSVREIHEEQELIGASKEVTIIQREVKFQRNGFLESVHKIWADGSESINQFAYLPSSDSYLQYWTSIFNSGDGKDTLRQEVSGGSQNVWKIRADSMEFNSDGNITYYRNKRDEVFTTYDKYGRKVKDSIPSHPNMMAHEITYKYGRRKVIKKEVYADQNLGIKTTYTIDEIGNWIKCTIKSNGSVKNAVLRREIVYFD